MVDTTFEDRIYDFYECAYEKVTGLSATNDVVLTAEGHADSDAITGIDLKRTRAYVEGIRREVTTVATVAGTTTVTLDGAALVASDSVEIYHAVATGTAGLAAAGKLSRPLIQTAQNYGVSGDSLKRASCGTKMKRTFVFSAGGDLSLGIDKQDHAFLSAISVALENDAWLLAVISDTSSGANKETIICEVQVIDYGEGVVADESARGIEQERVSFGFTPPVSFDTT